ncbi:MAG: hypothetical protein KDD44_11615, partial [Bdellovibrionales bacterium]|nr:hypothetical protein [Bdellovibrionales bacterium]
MRTPELTDPSSMTRNARRPLYLSVALLGLGGVLLFLLLRSNEKTFPPLAAGAYMGTISGVSQQERGRRTLYVQRLPDALLVVVFAEGWIPQVVPLVPIAAEQGTPVGYQPVIMQFQGRSFSLSGTLSGDAALGAVATESSVLGSWNLSPIGAEQARIGLSTEEVGRLQDLLVAKAEYLELSAEDERLKQRAA